jgi:hypothetical protein
MSRLEKPDCATQCLECLETDARRHICTSMDSKMLLISGSWVRTPQRLPFLLTICTGTLLVLAFEEPSLIETTCASGRQRVCLAGGRHNKVLAELFCVVRAPSAHLLSEDRGCSINAGFLEFQKQPCAARSHDIGHDYNGCRSGAVLDGACQGRRQLSSGVFPHRRRFRRMGGLRANESCEWRE